MYRSLVLGGGKERKERSITCVLPQKTLCDCQWNYSNLDERQDYTGQYKHTHTHKGTHTHTETKLLWTFTQQVNGRRVALPHTPSPLMTLSLAGQYVTVQTSFGLRVRWDGNHYAQITVPRSVQYKYLLYL